jgi:exosome complex RNA-binding protein Csl4
MTLEAGKELDRRYVLNWLNEVYVTPSRAYCKYTDDELRMFAHDALVLLNEQEAKHVIVTTNAYGTRFYHCPKCNRDLYVCPRQLYCSNCGQKVKWND